MELPNQTKIKTSLPYCLYKVDGRFFKLSDGFDTKVRFTKVETTPNRRTGSSQKIEVIRDRWGIDAHTDVEILTNKMFDDSADAEEFTINIVNEFVKKYIYFDRESIHLVPLTKEDLMGFSSQVGGKGVLVMNFAGGIKPVDPLRTHQVSNDIENAILQEVEIPLWDELLINAEQYIFLSDYRHSILESVIALEVVLSGFIRKTCKDKGLSEKDAKEYIGNIGLTGNVKVSLKLLINGVPLPDDAIFEKCTGGITLRNKIVHEARKSVSKVDAEEAYNNISLMIKFLSPLL